MGAIWALLKKSLIPSGGQILSFALWISVVGVMLGIVQLIVVLSVMSGFQQFLQKTYTDISSDLVVVPRASKHLAPNDLIEAEGVRAVSPFNLGQAMLTKEGAAGVMLEGIDEATTEGVTPWRRIWKDAPNEFPDPKEDWIWIGSQLARKIGAEKGDTVNLFIPGKNKIYPLRVTAVTKFGIYDHDLRYARVQLKHLDELMQGELDEPTYKVAVADNSTPEEVQWNITKRLGETVRVRLWSDVNQNLFKAVQHQKISLFAILEIVIALAAAAVFLFGTSFFVDLRRRGQQLKEWEDRQAKVFQQFFAGA
jgi:lipoprotein-releasing system permease protein